MASSEELSTFPFRTSDDITDVNFVVEGESVYFCKAFLQVSSPVFTRMFTSDFKEKRCKTIPLPEKSYEEMVIFFEAAAPCIFLASDIR